MSFEELWPLIGEVSTPVSFTGETPVPPSLQRRGNTSMAFTHQWHDGLFSSLSLNGLDYFTMLSILDQCFRVYTIVF
jgi:hypothetical protein